MPEMTDVREVEDAYLAVRDDDTDEVFELLIYEDRDGNRYVGKDMLDGLTVIPLELFIEAVGGFVVYE